MRTHPSTFKQLKTMEISDVYEKAMNVIDSCENEIQMEGAIKYCDLFKNQFIKTGSDELLINIYYKNLLNHINYRINENFGNLN